MFSSLAAAALNARGVADVVTTGSLARELADLRALAEFPEPYFKTIQFSSYDRRSALPGGPGWFANSDGFGGEPTPNFEGVVREPDETGAGEYLVCDVEGPGAIVRQWTAAIEGDIRVYLDDAAAPVFDGPASVFFRTPYRPFLEAAGLDDAPFRDTFVQRNAAYCPIPFARRCRITWTGKVEAIHFYEVNLRVYDKTANVRTFAPEDMTEFRADFEESARILRDPDAEYPLTATDEPDTFEYEVAPGEVVEALTREGAGAFEQLRLLVTAEDRDLALRQTVMSIQFDRHDLPQVEAPVGDFFGAAPGVNPMQTLPFTVAPDGWMTCRHLMPFAGAARVTFQNLGEQPVRVKGAVRTGDYAWGPRSMHFRARWRITHDIEASPLRDMPYLLANGTGRYVGTALYLLNPCNIPRAHGSWWGEGDEKIFVDDDTFPSTFGTGSEDYFNYAWSQADIFVYPHCGQPRDDGPANRGFVTNFRWHVLDSLPFRNRLSFYMELWPHTHNLGMAYARVGYHYGRPGMMDDHVCITRGDVRPQQLPPWEPVAELGAANARFFQPEDCLRSDVTSYFITGDRWSRGKLFRWRPESVGEEAAFAFEVPRDGNYLVWGVFVLDAESGTIAGRIDDDAECFGDQGRLALHDPHRVLARELGARRVALTAGEHTLTLRYEGHPEKRPDASIGIDFLWVQPA